MVKCLICPVLGGCGFHTKMAGKNAIKSQLRLCCASYLLEEALISEELCEASVSLVYEPNIFFCT